MAPVTPFASPLDAQGVWGQGIGVVAQAILGAAGVDIEMVALLV